MSDLAAAITRQPNLSRYASHLFQRLNSGHLTLVTGAGISLDAKIPSWRELLERLAVDIESFSEDVTKYQAGHMHPEYLGQIVFHRHQSKCPKEEGVDDETWVLEVTQKWAASIHDALYEKVGGTTKSIVSKHPYLRHLASIALRTPLVINFNFDDLLDDAMIQIGSRLKPPRRVSTVWRPPLVDRQGVTAIYHVNGVLPRGNLKKRSEQLVFTEDSFSSAMARSPDLGAEYLFLRFVQNSMLIVGHSLSDSSLKDYLRRNKERSPANFHYMIHWLEEPDTLTAAQCKDIFDANRELYNLVTLFMTSSEIGSFLRLLNLEEDAFTSEVESWGQGHRTIFHYYIVGPVAAGKSSVLEQLRCFGTYEEWSRPPPEEMYLSYKKLTSEQKKIVDQFLYPELREKNKRMATAGPGIHFMDRGPLDLYAFSEDDEERREKTAALRSLVTRELALQGGEIVFLVADGKTLVKRNRGRGRPPEKAGEEKYLEGQAKDLEAAYETVFPVETRLRSSGDVAKAVAQHALLDEYLPINLMNLLVRYE